jgi:DNA-directed RNA polymerase subunit RPC12/RpoP
MKCDSCGGEIISKPNRVADKNIYDTCMDKLVKTPLKCPNCNSEIVEADFVGFMLTPQSVTRIPEHDVEISAVVCPHCKVLFLDQLQYDMLLGLRRKLNEDLSPQPGEGSE